VTLFRGFLVGLFLVTLLSGCIRPPTRSVQTDDKGWSELVEGIRSFEASRYSEAKRRFLKMIESYPGSPLLSEAQWLLARTYDAAGEKPEAIRELRFFLKNYPKSLHEEEARFLLSRLEQPDQKIVAVIWSPLSGWEMEDYLRAFRRRANTVIIPVFNNAPGQSGVFFRASGAPLLADRLREWTETAHRMGFRLMAAMPIREMRWATTAHPEWRDAKYDPSKGTLHSVEKLDLFNPEVKEMVLGLYRDLARYPIDGLYLTDLTYEADEGWTLSATRLYEGLFSESIDPGSVVAGAVGRTRDGRGPQFWHWIGWRSRYLSDLVKNLQSEVRLRRPDLLWGAALPEIVLTQPVKGLAETSVDLLDIKRAENDIYLIFPQSSPGGAQLLLDTVSKYAIRPQEVWLQPTSNNRTLLSEAMNSPFQGLILPSP
jgi:hypothetical protein